MEAKTVIEKLGGTIATAKLLGIKPPSVAEWKIKNVVPAARVWQLKVVRPDLFAIQSTPEQDGAEIDSDYKVVARNGGADAGG